MKAIPAILAVGLMLYLGPSPARAQTSSVRITVKKNTKTDRKTADQKIYDNYAIREHTDTTSLKVEVHNAGSRPLVDAVAKWAILVRPAYGQELKFIEGEQNLGTLNFNQRVAFETDAVQTTERFYSQNETRPYWHRNQKPGVEGYAVEIFSAGKLVGSDISPASTRKQIEELKGNAGKAAPDDPRVHKF